MQISQNTMLSSLVVILTNADDEKSLSRFFSAFEQHLTANCAVVVVPALSPHTPLSPHFLPSVFNATGLPVEIAIHQTVMAPAKVYITLPADNLLIEQNSFVLGSPQIQEQYFTHFWESVAACPVAGKVGLAVDASPQYFRAMAAINQSGGITLCSLPALAHNNTPPLAQELKFFNYVQKPAELALTITRFLQLFEPDKQTETTQDDLVFLPDTNPPQPDAAEPPATLPLTTVEPASLQTNQSSLYLLTQALNATQTGVMIFSEQGNLLYHNPVANLYANTNNRHTLAQTTFFVLLPNITADAQTVLQTGNPIEYTLTNADGKPVSIKIIAINLPNQKALVLVFAPLLQAEEMEHRFQLLKDELETQGIEQIKTILQLKREITANESQRQLLESILANMGEGVLATNEIGQIILLNQRAAQITGITQPNTHITQWMEQYHFFYPDDKTDTPIPFHLNPFARGLQAQTVKAEEWRVAETPSGMVKFWQIHSRPYKVNSNTLQYGAVMVITDITARKQAELDLLSSQQTQKALLDAVPDLLFRVNQQGIYLDYIPAKTDSHIPPAAFIGNHLADVMPAEIAKDLMEQLQIALKSMQVQTFPFELISNTIKFYETRFSPINTSEALGIVRDVTDIIVGKDAIRRGTRHYQRLLASSNFAVLVCSRKGEIIYANPAAAQLLHYNSAQELTGKFVEEFILRKQRPQIREAIKEGFVEAVAFDPLRLTLITKNNHEITGEVSGSVITYENHLAVQLTIHNITLQTEWEKQFWLLLQANNSPSAWLHPEKQTITHANAAFLELLGITNKNTLLKKKWIAFAPTFQPDGIASASKWAAISAEVKKNGATPPFIWLFDNAQGHAVTAQITILSTPPANNSHTVAGKWIAIVNAIHQ